MSELEHKSFVQLDMEMWFPKDSELMRLDIAPMLKNGFVLVEKDFRQVLETMDWQEFEGKHTLIFCSLDAIVPQWAFMLLSSYLVRVNARVYYRSATFEEEVMIQKINSEDFEPLKNQRILVKGCNKKNISPLPYMFLIEKLQPLAKSIAYGEKCSSVPIFKKVCS